MRKKTKAHHVAIVAVCTIAVFVVSFEIGKRVHLRASEVRPPFHGFINQHGGPHIRSDDGLLAFASLKGAPRAGIL
jgi:hypothetical protein